MKNRKILYGFQIQRGEIMIHPPEVVVVRRIASLYIEGLSYQKIADALNRDGIPFSLDAPLWNKHKIKRLLENPRYTGKDGYPAIIDTEQFLLIQYKIRSKTEGLAKPEKRPALMLKNDFYCHCGGQLYQTASQNQAQNILHFKCKTCGKRLTVLEDDLLSEVSRQLAEHDASIKKEYAPSAEVIRLANAINRGLENPDMPAEVVKLILQGISARYNCCPTLIEHNHFIHPAKIDFKAFGQVISYITLSDENTIIVHFK